MLHVSGAPKLAGFGANAWIHPVVFFFNRKKTGSAVVCFERRYIYIYIIYTYKYTKYMFCLLNFPYP